MLDLVVKGGQVVTPQGVALLLRGKVIVENGRLLGSSSDGKWLPRRVSGDILSRPAL